MASTVGANTFASHWNLSQGKLSRIVFLHALRHGFVLMGDEVLLQHSQFFKKHPTMVAEALKQLEALEHALIPQKEYPLDGQALFDHIFLHVPGQSFNLPQRDLVESIRDKCEEAEISIDRKLAHTIEALILSQHEFVARINEEKLPKYWGDLHAAGLEEFEVEGVEWSPPFKLILDEAKKYRPRKKRFVEAVTSVTDPRKALNLLRMDDSKRVFYGATLEGKSRPDLKPSTNLLRRTASLRSYLSFDHQTRVDLRALPYFQRQQQHRACTDTGKS